MTRTTALAAALLTGLTMSACGGSDPLEGDSGGGGEEAGSTADDGSTEDSGGGGGDTVTVGSANFPENVLLAQIYAAALDDAGVTVDTRLNIGNRETYIQGIQDGSIDLIPEYTGNLTLFFEPEAEATDPEGVYSELEEALPEGLTVLERSEAEDKDSLVVTRETAEADDLEAIPDLEPLAGDLVLGGPPEFKEREYGVPGLKEVYGLEFASFRPLAAGSNLTVQSLTNGQVDVANIFSTDPSIAANDFVVLDDPESLFVAQNIVPLISEDAVNDDISEALDAVSGELDTDGLTDMVSRVVTDGEKQEDVTREFVDNL